MSNTRVVASFLLALVLPMTGQADAQIGGLIKKKVSESIKGTDKKDQATPKGESAATPDGGQTGSKLPRALSEATLVAFKKGLTVERDQRQVTLKFLATLKTQDEYNACSQALASSAEGQKAMTSGNWGNVNKMLAEKCGESPTKYHDTWKRNQLEAARLAGVKAFAAGLAPASGSGGPFLSAEEQPDDSDFYELLKEWTPPFCNLSKSAQQAAAEKGVSVPGSGKGIAYVYTAVEGKLLVSHCGELMPLLSALQ
jgi:hypothetical protein